MTLDQLDRTRRGPVIIKERVRAIGGQLTIDKTGVSNRLELALFAGHHGMTHGLIGTTLPQTLNRNGPGTHVGLP